MRGLERLLATVTIWVVFGFMLDSLIGRFTRVSMDLYGIWPQFPTYFTVQGQTEPDWQQIQEISQQISNDSNAIVQQLTTTISQTVNDQLAANMPILVILALALIMAATVSTVFIWRSAILPDAVAESEKNKRRSKVEQFVNKLDAHELDELRARIMESDDQEGVSLAEMLAVREKRR
ncbi:MAG: hypothetical protein K8L97_10975 [Anaerolineae bacterium]|nr:hypothetical protein [Anaerolineae bacterium]